MFCGVMHGYRTCNIFSGSWAIQADSPTEQTTCTGLTCGGFILWPSLVVLVFFCFCAPLYWVGVSVPFVSPLIACCPNDFMCWSRADGRCSSVVQTCEDQGQCTTCCVFAVNGCINCVDSQFVLRFCVLVRLLRRCICNAPPWSTPPQFTARCCLMFFVPISSRHQR